MIRITTAKKSRKIRSLRFHLSVIIIRVYKLVNVLSTHNFAYTAYQFCRCLSAKLRFRLYTLLSLYFLLLSIVCVYVNGFVYRCITSCISFPYVPRKIVECTSLLNGFHSIFNFHLHVIYELYSRSCFISVD